VFNTLINLWLIQVTAGECGLVSLACDSTLALYAVDPRLLAMRDRTRGRRAGQALTAESKQIVMPEHKVFERTVHRADLKNATCHHVGDPEKVFTVAMLFLYDGSVPAVLTAR